MNSAEDKVPESAGPFCAYCIHYTYQLTCEHPSARKMAGEYEYASIHRKYGECGAEARYYEEPVRSPSWPITVWLRTFLRALFRKV